MLVLDWLLRTNTAGCALFVVFLLLQLAALIAVSDPDLNGERNC